jgi:hypothetical protein
MFGLPIYSMSTHVRSGTAQVFGEFVATFGLLSVIWGSVRHRPARFHIIRQSGGNIGAIVFQHFRRHPASGCTCPMRSRADFVDAWSCLSASGPK